MGIVLFRVDERLIHGQVVIGWGNQLRPGRYVVVDNELHESAWEQDLYRLTVPGHAQADFHSVEEAAGKLAEWRGDGLATVVLFRSLAAALALAKRGLLQGDEVNLGGVHHKAGGRAICPYLHLDSGDREAIKTMVACGVKIMGQDLPSSPRLSVADLIDD